MFVSTVPRQNLKFNLNRKSSDRLILIFYEWAIAVYGMNRRTRCTFEWMISKTKETAQCAVSFIFDYDLTEARSPNSLVITIIQTT